MLRSVLRGRSVFKRKGLKRGEASIGMRGFAIHRIIKRYQWVGVSKQVSTNREHNRKVSKGDIAKTEAAHGVVVAKILVFGRTWNAC